MSNTYEKIENTILTTQNINLLRDMLIEVINNNVVDLDLLYLVHKREINTQFESEVE